MLKSFLRLNLAKKMLIGYLPLIVLVLAIAGFALGSLERLKRLSLSVVRTDVPLAEAIEELNDALIAQESFARRSIILKDNKMKELFAARSEEFARLVQRIQNLQGDPSLAAVALSAVHADYSRLMVRRLELTDPSSAAERQALDEAIRVKQAAMEETIRAISTEARSSRHQKTLLGATVAESAFRIAALLCGIGVALAVAAALAITRNISGSIHRLKLATAQIAEGRFDGIPTVRNEDELGELSHAVEAMAKRLKQLEAMSLDANPLTRLPGGAAIEKALEDRLETGRPLAFCLFDLDNFKAFGDKYGYAHGSEVIKVVARLLEEVMAEQGAAEDFIGHVGGDDFVIITSPERALSLCNPIIERFDAEIVRHYDPEDIRRGYIDGKTRQGEPARFPIMSVSIAVVTNRELELRDSLQVGELAAEWKEFAKSLPGSVCVVDGQPVGAEQPAGAASA